ncbi:MAG: Mov34/MPN/PAD-1 family protein [Candidatus Edwardsbacteria bacterium]|nr:Mov34/MPN/PAD-1 family protein [Candidatus Edwardsbacteria bacterium]MBU2595006.1 Mov34/MPN/PAD-1 family protein [Candidatus Edwardsbacteria bacterium]
MSKYRKYPLEILRVSESIHGIPMSSPEKVYEYMKAEALADREIFWVLHINNKNRVVKKEMTAMGTVNSCAVVPGIVLRSVVANGVPCIVTVHNHPSGDPAPSQEDRNLWRSLGEGCKLLGITLVDNIIIGTSSYYSETESRERR